MGGIGRTPPPPPLCARAGQHIVLPRQMNMASCGRQPQVSPLPPTGVQAVLSARWQSCQVPSMFQWVAIGGCIPHIRRATPTHLVCQNSCTNLHRHMGKFLPCLLQLPPLLHILQLLVLMEFMTFQTACCSKCFPTYIARMFFITCMSYHVSF